MAGFITFDRESPEKTWSSANWVFRGFLDHVTSVTTIENDVVHKLTACKHYQRVGLDDMAEEQPEMFQRVLAAFKLGCSQIAGGNYLVSVNGNELDEESQNQYREAIHRLSELLATESHSEDESVSH